MIVASAILLTISGCTDKAKSEIRDLATEVAKDSAQRQAEENCWRVAAIGEKRRFGDFRAITNGPFKTTKLGVNHYLIKANYKIITLSDPGEKSDDLCMYGNTICESQDTKIVSAKVDADTIRDICPPPISFPASASAPPPSRAEPRAPPTQATGVPITYQSAPPLAERRPQSVLNNGACVIKPVMTNADMAKCR